MISVFSIATMQIFFDEKAKGKEKIYVCHANRFCKEEIHHSLAKIFIPTEELQTRIDKITSNWAGKNVIGLHIRRTDNVTAISLSPDECFHNIIDQELIKDGNSLFYVASDDQTVKDELCKKIWRTYYQHTIVSETQ